MAMPEEHDKFGRYALVLVAIGALGRLPAITLPGHSPILVYFDGSYIQSAQYLLTLNFHAMGKRVPVYPLLVALCGLNPRVIWLAQSILGIAASLMIFQMAFRRTRHGLFSLLVGLACSLAPEVLVYESSVMTETLTSFLLVTTLWFITRHDEDGEGKIWYPLGVGLLVAMTCLTHPLMICLAPVYFFFLTPFWPPTKILQRAAIKRTLAFALPVVVLVLSWCGFVYLNSGFFTPTTAAGHNVMDQVDPYVELAPEQFAVLREEWILSRLRSQHFPNKNACPVFDGAVPEVQKRTGQSQAQVWHEYQSLAFYLEVHHPLLFFRRAEQGWMRFWGEPTLDETEWPDVSTVNPGELMMTLSDFMVREVKAVFLVLALLSIPCALVRLKAFTKLEYLTFAMVLWVSVFSSLTEFGENRRFCVPFYMLILYTLLTRCWLWISAASSQASEAPSASF
jgi:hypothetical protein